MPFTNNATKERAGGEGGRSCKCAGEEERDGACNACNIDIIDYVTGIGNYCPPTDNVYVVYNIYAYNHIIKVLL